MSNLNELKPIISLNPFARFCCTIGNLPSSYMASLTYEEQLLWLCDYLENTIIPTVNNNAECVKELQELYVKLKNYVDNYFKNLDVQNEINNKLDEMAQDGTLTNLISNYVNPFINEQNQNIENFKNDVNIKLLNKSNSNYAEYFKNNFIFTISYDENNHYFLYASQDGINYVKIKEIKLPTNSLIWDISIIYKDNYFYICGDTRKNNIEGTSGGDTIRFFKTNDFETYETWDLEGLSLFNEIWAPEFLQYNNNIYLVVSMSLPTDISDYKGFMHKPYIIGLNEDLTSISSQPKELNLFINSEVSESDRIDPQIIIDNNNFYLVIKSRKLQCVQLFKSDSLNSDFNFINNFDYSYLLSNGKYEGPSIIKFNNCFILTLQGALQRNKIPKRYNYILLSDNIENLQYAKYNLSFNNSKTTMMHFTPLVITDNNAKLLINEVYKKSNLLIEQNNNTINKSFSFGLSNENLKFNFLEKNGFSIIDFRILNNEGFSNGDVLFTIPKYVNYVKNFTCCCSQYLTYGGLSNNCNIFINNYGEVKVSNLPSDLTIKQISAHIIIDSNEFSEKL